jgi:hypothetical protein
MGDIVEESTQKNDKNVDGKVFGQSNEIGPQEIFPQEKIVNLENMLISGNSSDSPATFWQASSS